ncbi:alternate-type signal peptide domain-containing protein [Cellulomonas dongxiuzhuiae]|uniref:Alternate-type signal peptide domain-containing protein n=1 Tax=Cellulomonas dongxiuzhuiae TaxID=2819979 RepID=A0ABX8GH76_9CELL|nr:alternate-type signal peptide domain-containing protein [Cellulomonas dongxiuzhuiae]MBO3094187.1 alternate-type signal peptide domain-containing protein [Cellulomonas dongxiuzhuiae]QWC15242.1 alternate-type signal peptide domain-containing protein [Cellulomonas dongxiuzhuiae]
MNKKTKGILAGTAGIALLTGGATFAEWSDDATQDGGTITSGNLEVAPVGTPTWYDVSSDRTDGADLAGLLTGRNGHVVDANWRIVPGDTAVAEFGFAVALEGDNLVANIDLTDIEALEGNGATVDYKVFNAAGTEITPATGNLIRLRGADGASDLGGAAITRTELDDTETTADVTVVVEVTFPDTLEDRDRVQTVVADLTDVGVSLEQVRTGAGF